MYWFDYCTPPFISSYDFNYKLKPENENSKSKSYFVNAKVSRKRKC